MSDVPEREILIGDLHGIKQLRRVAGLLATLHQVGCDRDKAANRELHFDDYVLLILLYLFNPLIDSMRTLQKVAALPEVQKPSGHQAIQPRQLQRELPRLQARDAAGGHRSTGRRTVAHRARRVV